MSRGLRFVIFIILTWATGCKDGDEAQFRKLRASIYKIQTTAQLPNLSMPWKLGTSSGMSGSGFYIGDGRILTNAHVVAHGKYITVQRDGDADSRQALVEFVAHDCDLAILKVDEPKYFSGVKPMQFGALPKLRSPVATIGYPTGGDQLSITNGIVSRISYRDYAHAGPIAHLLVQVDAAINPGNSGGPVIQEDKVVGVAFQGLTHAEATGYIIPYAVVERFLRDIADGRYDGHLEDAMDVLPDVLENPATAAYFGLPEGRANGVVVHHIPGYTALAGALKAGDVINGIDGYDVGVDGRIDYEGERIDFKVVYDLKLKGESIAFKIVRDGKSQDIVAELKPSAPHPPRANVYESAPDFVVFGGLTFTELTRDYLQTYGQKWYLDAPVLQRYLYYFFEFVPEFAKRPSIIVYSARLPHAINAYADVQQQAIVESVNDEPVATLADLRRIFTSDAPETQNFVIKFFKGRDPVVIPRELVRAVDPKIKAAYQVHNL